MAVKLYQLFHMLLGTLEYFFKMQKTDREDSEEDLQVSNSKSHKDIKCLEKLWCFDKTFLSFL